MWIALGREDFMDANALNRDAVIYAPASRGREDGRTGVHKQLERCRTYAMSCGYHVQHEFSAGINGEEGLTEALCFLNEHPGCHHLIAETADRLTLSDFYQLKQLGIKVHFVEEEQFETIKPILRRAPGVRAKKMGKRLARGCATQLMIYPRPTAKALIVEGSRLADLSASSFCIMSALKETARLMGRTVEDLGIDRPELRFYGALRSEEH